MGRPRKGDLPDKTTRDRLLDAAAELFTLR
ncbi:MAG: hypothetical protein QOK03_800, partial [Candidatus Binataceae bacterium]|nr:hypothetical protein [Candidatus Binataceae bacterium]